MYLTKIKYKILVFFFVIGIVPFLASVIIEYFQAIKTLENKAQDQLRTVRELKRKEIEGYFEHSHLEIGFFAQSASVVEAIKDFKMAFNTFPIPADQEKNRKNLEDYYKNIFLPRLKLDKNDTLNITNLIPKSSRLIALQNQYLIGNSSKLAKSNYGKAHDKFHPIFSDFLSSQGYYDLFLVDDATGDILYTVKKETDFSTNLLNGPYSNTNLGKLFRQVRLAGEKNKAVMCDYERYVPSYNAPAAFISAPIFELNKRIGTIILQIPIERIDAITTSRKEWREEGLGETGESYILGKDCKMRTNSRMLIENPITFFKTLDEINVAKNEIELMKRYQTSVLFQTTCNENVFKASHKQIGIKQVLDYQGKQVLSAYTPLSIPQVEWVFLAEIDIKEAYAPVKAFAKRSIIILSLALAIIVIATLVLAKNIYSPIIKLTTASKQLSEGNLDIQVFINRKDEIGELAKVFNHMARSFKSQKSEILKKNDLLEHQKSEIAAQADNLLTLNKEISKINSHLDDLVKNRTLVLEIQNSKLTEYAFLNSHKLRAPVATILGLINVIKQSEDIEDKLVCIDLLAVTTNQLDKVIKEIQEVINDVELG